MVYVIYICIAVPVLLMLSLIEKNARYIIGFMIVGMTVAILGFELNSFLNAAFGMTETDFTSTVTPISEEILKTIPVLFFALAISDKKNLVLSVAMGVGVGFAIIENAYLLFSNLETASILWAFMRGISSALLHGMCTAIVGYGITFVKKQKKLFYTGTFGLISVSITLHAIYNLLVSSADYRYIASAIPVVIYISVIIFSRLYRKKEENA